MSKQFALAVFESAAAIARDQLLAWIGEFEPRVVEGSPVADGRFCAIAVDFLPASVAADMRRAGGTDNPGSQRFRKKPLHPDERPLEAPTRRDDDFNARLIDCLNQQRQSAETLVRCGKIRMKNAVEIEEDCFCRTHIVSLAVKIQRLSNVPQQRQAAWRAPLRRGDLCFDALPVFGAISAFALRSPRPCSTMS